MIYSLIKYPTTPAFSVLSESNSPHALIAWREGPAYAYWINGSGWHRKERTTCRGMVGYSELPLNYCLTLMSDI